MKKMRYSLVRTLSFIVGLSLLASWTQERKPAREFYQFTIYHYKSAEQEKVLDSYLQNALLPALHRMKIGHIGVFKAISNDTSSTKMLYVLVPVKSLEMITKIPSKLSADKEYQSNGADYINAVVHGLALYPDGNNFTPGISPGPATTSARIEGEQERQGL